MSEPVEIIITQGESQHRRWLSEAHFRIGRAPDNDLSLADDQLSWHHAVIWVEGGLVWVCDLSSTNGTFIDDVRIRPRGSLGQGAVLSVGSRTTIRLGCGPLQESMPRFVLEDVCTGIRQVLEVGTLTPGEARARSIGLPGPLTLTADGGLSVLLSGQAHPLELEAVFAAPGGQRIRVTSIETLQAPTVGFIVEPFPYRLSVTLNGTRGGEALLSNRKTGAEHQITSETRVVLLYQLVKKSLEDRKSLRPEDWGWCRNEDLIVGVWGRGRGASSNLLVLIHRIRRELEHAGFSPDVLEKKRNILRLRLVDVELR